MATCTECGRPLNAGEVELCPACTSSKSHKKKRWTEIIGGVVLIVALGALKAFSGGKDDGGSA